eukprot:CAMPEP_0197180594 /NCGR_PEP_ID=MMETSP1423-20130617/5152_1 /TAXON_ID=476441 /ORGANISM="Pseudo-nitzschia heimii, Strain UNC1101" /LENGTH=520 /DNA_ID=CAMNT_0042630693 /DNA_START=116 /DNA_END=1678 /DNA_ORIENTATION=-
MAARDRRQEPWQRETRYHCVICNVWMGSDRQSILLHENGKKHKENSEHAMLERRAKKQREQRAQNLLSDSLKKMERVAHGETGELSAEVYTRSHEPRSATPTQSNSNHDNNPLSFLNQRNHNNLQSSRESIPTRIKSLPTQARAPRIGTPQTHNNLRVQSINQIGSQFEQERIDWQTQKLKREDINIKKRKNREGHDNEKDEEEVQNSKMRQRVSILPGEGYYSYDYADKKDCTKVPCARGKEEGIKVKNAIYLEGNIFFGLLEKEMPVQVWTGSSSCGIEKRRSMNITRWKNALILRVVYNRSESTRGRNNELLPMVDVSYLSSPDDKQETIERKISIDRIRIVLGADKNIPDSLEEARLLAMGGEELHFPSTTNGEDLTTKEKQDFDATGLSGWQTVSIKRTTHRQNQKEEKRRLEERKVHDFKRREVEKERNAMRRLEESRVSNADDSALGAFDVFDKMTYKGIDISKEFNYSVEDSVRRLGTVKSRTSGVKVAFKKRGKKKVQKAARRTTFGDEDV